MILILWISLVASYRLLKLKLKESEDLFVTNSKGTLKLLPLSIPNQSVVVHSRRLFFVQQGLLYKMYLNPGSLEIHLKNDRREIGFLKSGSPRKKRVNPFSFASRKPKREEAMSPKEFSRSKERNKVRGDNNNSKIDNGSRVDINGSSRIDNNSRYTNRYTNRYSTKIDDTPTKVDDTPTKVEDIPTKLLEDTPTKVEDTTKIEYTTRDEDSSAKQIEILKTILASLDRNKSPPPSSPPPTPPLQSDKEFVESDSKIDEDTLKYQQVDVFVSSLDRTYFKLKTSTNNCVTFHHNSFIFTPCINIDNQIFKLVKEEEIKKNVEDVEDEDDEDVEEYVDEDVDEDVDESRKRKSTKIKRTKIKKKDGKRINKDYAHKRINKEDENKSEEENKSSGLLSYDKQMREKFKDCKNLKVFCNRKSKEYNEEACREVIEKCEDGEKEQNIEKKNIEKKNVENKTKVETKNVEDKQPLQNYSHFFNTPSQPSPSQPLQPTSNIIRSILKSEAVKKDFNPDDIIEKLQNSINTNDFADLM